MKSARTVDELEVSTIKYPPARGPGSGRAAWIALIEQIAEANKSLEGMCRAQADVIRDLEAEVALLREHIATRKPKGGRERTPEQTISAIERALSEGYSTRKIGELYRVSPMTVSRVRKRMDDREARTA